MQNKFLSNLGLAHRAGKIICGTESVRDSIKRRRALLVIVSCDISEKQKKEILDSASFYKVEAVCVPYTMSELSDALGKTSSVACAAITDIGFKTLAKNSLEHQEV